MMWGIIFSTVAALASIYYAYTPVWMESIAVVEHPAAPAQVKQTRDWWKEAVFYQVYLRSYQDSNGDGVGDIRGLIERLPHLSELGVDAIWISPIHPSPDVDFGYDVMDYYSVHPKYGNFEDFNDLIRACKQRNIKVILDLVVNHTSEQHPWFLEARSSRKSPKRDWYIWADKPNNWLSRLDESAWVYDPPTDQYYMHSFFKEQPDLNWRNPEVRAEIEKIMKFWLNKGVAGFRLDLANYYLKHAELEDNPKTDSWGKWLTSVGYGYHAWEHINDKNHFPDLLDAYRSMRSVADFYGAVLLAEADVDDGEGARVSAALLGQKSDGAHLAFNFDFLGSPFKAKKIAEVIRTWEQFLPAMGWPVYTLSNHDKVRHFTRYGNSDRKARLAAMMLLTLKGTPVLYYGEEIGMKEAQIDWKDLQDPLHRVVTVAAWLRYMTNDPKYSVKRDECRTPMRWEPGEYAGFSTQKPWVAMSPETPSVQEEQTDYHSLYWLYKKLIYLRKENDSLRVGQQSIQEQTPPDVLMYSRSYEGKTVWVALNMGEQTIRLSHPTDPKLHLSTYGEYSVDPQLRPWEGLIWSY